MPIINHTLVSDIFLSFLLAKCLITGLLNYRNKKHIMVNRHAVPEKFQKRISLSDHQRAADYTTAKLKAEGIFGFFDFLILISWTLMGGLEFLDSFVRFVLQNEILRGLFFFASMGFISYLLNLPQTLYSTFVLEEKFGFNKTTPKLFIHDSIKSLIIGSVIGLPVLATVLWILQLAGSSWWILAWSFLTMVQLVLIWAYPRFIAPWFNKFSPLPEGELKTKIVDLLSRTGFKSKGLFVMDASKRSGHGNAYFTGFGKNKRIVFFDTLIKTLDAKEAEAVLAHELGHFKKKHVLKGFIQGMIFSLAGFAILGFLYQWMPFFQGHGVQTPSNYMALALFSMVYSTYTFLLTPISNILSRKHEFEADQFAKEHASVNKMISALIKLYQDNASTLTPDPLYSSFYYSHPPAMARIEHLEKGN